MAITRRNYTPGQYETFTGEPVGTPVLNTPTAFKLDGLFSFDVADDVILIQGGSAIPTTAYELLTDNLYTAKEAGYSGLTVVKMFKITNATYAGIATTASGKNFGSAVDNDILWSALSDISDLEGRVEDLEEYKGDTEWTEVTSLLNGWTGTLYYIKRSGFVTVTGTISGGSATSSAFFTMLTGYKPAVPIKYSMESGGVVKDGTVDTYGTCYAVTGTDSLTFSATYPVL